MKEAIVPLTRFIFLLAQNQNLSLRTPRFHSPTQSRFSSKLWFLVEPERLEKTLSHKNPHNSGDDIDGTIEKFGENVTELKLGHRVAAFHEMMIILHGSSAEYAIAWAHKTFHLPKKSSFEEAATIPPPAMTAELYLYLQLKLLETCYASIIPIPLTIYGVAGAVGAFAIKIAQASNIHLIITILAMV